MSTKYEPKTVGEQAAFEFGEDCRGFNEARKGYIGRRYAFTHQYSVFPRADNGYGRLLKAFCAGAGLDINEV